MSVEICVLDDSHIKRFEEQKAWLHGMWEKDLEAQGVKWPGGPVAISWLVGLSFFLERPVDKNSLGLFANKIAGGSTDAQARHLRSKYGWYIVSDGRGPPEYRRLVNGTHMPKGTYALASLRPEPNLCAR
ncbi:MAG TPA: hypothetical protein DDX54_05800 [Rhodospirillaceae bacterium]|jgi:hypothetical protein|nr:hypothetical protein [Rhodospirillaceae bacterium]